VESTVLTVKTGL